MPFEEEVNREECSEVKVESQTTNNSAVIDMDPHSNEGIVLTC